jgi:hypothetical protein
LVLPSSLGLIAGAVLYAGSFYCQRDLEKVEKVALEAEA